MCMVEGLIGGSKIELLKDIIFKGKSNNTTEGSILANFIEQLLVINGYVIEANPGNIPDGGNYIEAISYDRLLSTDVIDRLFIEIRDRNDSDGISFDGLKRMQQDPRYASHRFFYLAFETVNDGMKEEFINHGINVLDGENLADRIFENINDSSAARARIKHLCN